MSGNPYLQLLDEEEARVPATEAATTAPAKNPYLDTLNAEETQQRAVLRQVAAVNPEAAAAAKKLAMARSLPPEVVMRNLEEIKRQELVEDGVRRFSVSPALSDRMRDIGFAQVAHDDLENLSKLEARFNQLGSWERPKTEPTLTNVAAGIAQALPQGFRAAKAGMSLQAFDAFSAAFGADETRKKELFRRYEQTQSDVRMSTPDFESDTARGLYSGGTSLVRQLPGTVLSIMTRSPVPALSSAGLMTEAEAYGKYRARGGSAGEAFAGAAGEGAVEALTELIPMKTMLKAFAKPGMATELLKSQVQEQFGEQIATVLQDAIDTAIANPEKTWGQYLEERPAAAYQTALATLVQSGAMGGAHAAARGIANRMDAGQGAAQEAERRAAIIEDANKLGAASKVAGRDATAFKQLISDIAKEEGDAPTEMWVDGQTLVNTLNQSGMTMQEFSAVAPTVAAQLQEGDAGHDLRVPVSEFMLVGEEITAPLVDHIRIGDPDAPTRLEAREILATKGEAFKAEMEAELSKQDDQAAFRQSIDAVRAQFEAELNNAKRFTPAVNKAYSELLANFYGATASRLGMTPDALLDKYKLRVQAQGVAGERTLNQVDTATPEFSAWFGESKVVDEAGKPLVVYHGTGADITEFDPAMADGSTSTSETAKLGIWFSEDPRVASTFAEMAHGQFVGSGANVMPVHLALKNPLRASGDELEKLIDGEWRDQQEVRAFVTRMKARAKNGGHDGIVFSKPASPAEGDQFGAVAYVAFHPEQIKSATGNRGTFDPNDANILNQSATPEQAALAALSQSDEIFNLPKSTQETIEGIAADIDPTIKVRADLAEGLDRYILTMKDGSEASIFVRTPSPYGPQSYGSRVDDGGINKPEIVRPGEDAFDMRAVDDVWINVSQLKSGGFGSAVYAIAGDFAHNTGKVFIGDPAGVSDAAMRRRPEQMLSSALRWGTTEHLAPHPRQVAGDPEIGIPPLKWVAGDGIGNIRRLVEVNIKALENAGHDDSNISFDTSTGHFIDSNGEEIGRDGIALWVEAGLGRGALAGSKTLARGSVLRALLREEGAGVPGENGQRDGLLARIAKLASDTPEATKRLFQGAEGVTPRAQIAFPADIAGSPSVISLLAGADLSSFIHESSHFFLEVQSDLATRIQQQIDSGASVTPAERGIVDDMNRLLQWFGVKGNENQTALAEWSTMTLDQKRESHETFARGFERFTMEGQAPSIALQEVFSRFRSWLVQVYKTLRGLNVELNDDVRAVMGRMLATDFAIEEAEAQRSMGALFKDAESAGMTLDEFSAYQATAQGATDNAAAELQVRGMKDMKWLSRAKDKAIKARQQEVDELRREIKNEVRSEVMAEPVYQAWQFLTGKQQEVIPGAQAVDEIDAVQQSGKLRTQVLREMYGTEETAVWRELSARRMTSDTSGMHPEIVAEMFGYDSADAMVKILAEAMPPAEVIDARTDQRMLEMFGDITSEEALQRAADEAVHNEARARFIATEMKALEAANKVTERQGKTTVNVLARAAKDYAQQIIARLKVREIRPNQYAVAEARNAKLAEKAFMAGKTEEAAMHKRNQLANNYATKAAYDAQAEVAAAQKYFRKFDKRSKSIDAGYQDQIEQMLERFDFRPASLKEVDRRKSFAAWVEEQRADGIEPSVPAELLDEANRKSYKDMTLEEIRGLRETVEQIEHLGRLKNRLLLARDQKDFDAAASEMAASIIEFGGKARPVELEGPNPVVDWFAGARAQHRKLASLFREMDGNKDSGPMYDLIGRAMNERGTMEDVMGEKATLALRDIYAPIMKLRGGTAGGKLYIPEIGASLSRGGRLSVALNWGNEANRQRVMDGDKWSEGQVRAILKTLTPVELKFVNDMWAYLDSFWPEVAAKEKRLTGVEPEKVEALPFNVTAADGTDVEMRGGYYPLKYDSDRSDRADQQEAAQAAKEMMQGAFTRATTRRGHTKERLQEVKRAVRKDLNVITQHVTQVTHDLAWHEWLIDTNKLLADDRVVSAIRTHYGPRVLKTMRDNVMGIATADVAPQTAIDTALLKLRSNVTRATMGASITTAFLQPFGLTQSMVRIGPKHVLRGMARWGGEAVRMENSLAWIHEKSDFMRLRAKTFNKELREIRGSVVGKSKTMRVVDAGLFALMQKMQMVADVPTWIGQYEKSIAEGVDEAAAVAMADRVVLESQGGGQTKDLAEVQRKHPMLTQFYSYFSVTLNLAAESTAATNFKNPAAVAGWLGDMALLMVIPAILPSFIMFALKGGGEDDDEKKMAMRLVEWQLGYLLGTAVGLRELSGGVGGFDYAGPPVGRVIGAGIKFGKQAGQGEIDEPLVLSTIDLMGAAMGIPTVQAIRSYKGWKAWDEEQEGAGPQSVLFGPPPKK